jgi:hypothetical protein
MLVARYSNLKWRPNKMRNLGKAWVAVVVVLVVLLLVGLGVFRWYISGYNRAVNLEQGAENAWANIDAALQRRLDLVPNLVEIVKGYAAHEKQLFENIAKSREKYFQSDSRAGKIEASNELSGFSYSTTISVLEGSASPALFTAMMRY